MKNVIKLPIKDICYADKNRIERCILAKGFDRCGRITKKESCEYWKYYKEEK